MKTHLIEKEEGLLAFQREQMKGPGRLEVTSPAFTNKGTIPDVHSAFGRNRSFPLNWTPGPTGTKSYALFVEDPDAHVKTLPVVHWLAWNIPVETTSLPAALPEGPLQPKGVRQGLNVKGAIGYMGPKPPGGDPAHHYNIQVFALDRDLELSSSAKRQDLLDACANHVLAAGVLVGMFEAPPTAPKS
jgi:Raf kinase inhibitor-like YbhB/YbcL family protein